MIRSRAHAKSLTFSQWKCVCSFYIIASSRSLLKCDIQMQEMREQEENKQASKQPSNCEPDCWADLMGWRRALLPSTAQFIVWHAKETSLMSCLLVKCPFLIFPGTFWILCSNQTYVIQDPKPPRCEVPTSSVKTGSQVEGTSVNTPTERWFIGLAQHDPPRDTELQWIAKESFTHFSPY